MNFNPEIKELIKISLEAGKVILEIYESGDFGIEAKSDSSPLTLADKKSHNVLVQGLETLFVNGDVLPILSEEGKQIAYETRKEWNQYWLIDPLDGTKEFIKKNGEFTVNIALIENQTPIAGFVYIPVKKVLYFAWEGFGAFKINEIDLENMEDSFGKVLMLDGGKREIGEDVRVVASRSHLSPETEKYIEKLEKEFPTVTTVSSGSSIKLCMVADGSADVYPRFAPTMEWDTAAAQAVCKMAGVQVIDVKTKGIMKYNRENLLNNWFLVSNNRSFEELL